MMPRRSSAYRPGRVAAGKTQPCGEEVAPLLGFLSGLKDVVIIVAALASIGVLILLAMLVLQVLDLVKKVKGETQPLLDDVHKTLQSVRGTSTFIGSELVSPLSTAVSAVTGVQRALQVLTDVRSWNAKARRNRQLREAVRQTEEREVAAHDAEKSA